MPEDKEMREIAVIEARQQSVVLSPKESMMIATQVANECKKIVDKTAVVIQKRRYVQVEGWETIANAHNCSLASRDVQKVDGGFKAIGEVIRRSDGAIIGRAEGFCGDDESSWKNRPTYAKMAMAQTRAMSRAARSAFAYILVMMNEKVGKDEPQFATTPAEEMPPETNGHDEGHEFLANAEDMIAAKQMALKAIKIHFDDQNIDQKTYDGWMKRIEEATTVAQISAMTKAINNIKPKKAA